MRIGVFIILAVILLGGLFYFFSPKPQVVKHPTINQSVTVIPSKNGNSDKLIPLEIKKNNLFSKKKVIPLMEGNIFIFTVTADHDDELHIHGYDKEIELKKD